MAVNSKSSFTSTSKDDARQSLINMLKKEKPTEMRTFPPKRKEAKKEKKEEKQEIKESLEEQIPEVGKIGEISKDDGEIESEMSLDELRHLFGSGFSPDEYETLYDIYKSYLNNYPLRTAMHKMALIKVCKCTLRYNQTLADNDTEAMRVWDMALSKALKEAKINPEQLSAADLSDGMTSFSQLSLAVEKAIDVVPILPQFIENPKDRVDYTLWEYINYARHLEGKPLIEYREIYGFLQQRYESLKKRYKFLKKEDDGQFDTDDIDSEV